MAKKPTPTKQDEADQITVNIADHLTAEQQIVYGKIVGPMTDALIERMTRLAKPYAKLDEFQQNDFIAGIKALVRGQLLSAIKVIAAAERPTLDAQVMDLSLKGTTVKVKLETVKTDANVLALSHALSQQVMIVFTEQQSIDDGSHKGVQAEPDQPALLADEPDLVDQADAPPLPPADDSDLAGEEEPAGWGEAAGAE